MISILPDLTLESDRGADERVSTYKLTDYAALVAPLVNVGHDSLALRGKALALQKAELARAGSDEHRVPASPVAPAGSHKLADNIDERGGVRIVATDPFRASRPGTENGIARCLVGNRPRNVRVAVARTE